MHCLHQHEELSHLAVYIATVSGYKYISCILVPGKKQTFIFLLNDILLSVKPDTIESPTINTVPFFHTSKPGLEVNQFGSLFSRACSDMQLLFGSKFSRFLF